MQATPTAVDFPAHLPFANLPRLQDDALQTIHKIMLHLSQTLTGEEPQEDEDGGAALARITTQRIRLCLQAARDILRFSPPGDSTAAPPSPRPAGNRVFATAGHKHRKPRSGAQLLSDPYPAEQMSDPPSPGRDGAATAHASPLLNEAEAALANPSEPSDTPPAPALPQAPPTPRREPPPERDTRFIRVRGELYNDYIRRRGTPYIPPQAPSPSASTADAPTSSTPPQC